MVSFVASRGCGQFEGLNSHYGTELSGTIIIFRCRERDTICLLPTLTDFFGFFLRFAMRDEIFDLRDAVVGIAFDTAENIRLYDCSRKIARCSTSAHDAMTTIRPFLSYAYTIML